MAICHECYKDLKPTETFGFMKNPEITFCNECFKKQHLNAVESVSEAPKFNEPEHYHQHKIDTLTFLQEGFPPEMAMGFIAGNIIKYIQRYPYKDGKKDLAKAVDYAKRFIAFVEEKDLLK